MENTLILNTENSSHVKVQSQNDADLFVDIKGIVHNEFIAAGEAVKQAFYHEVL